MTGKKPPRPVQRRKQLCVSLEPVTMREINEAAQRAGVTRSEWVRIALEAQLLEDGW